MLNRLEFFFFSLIETEQSLNLFLKCKKLSKSNGEPSPTHIYPGSDKFKRLSIFINIFPRFQPCQPIWTFVNPNNHINCFQPFFNYFQMFCIGVTNCTRQEIQCLLYAGLRKTKKGLVLFAIISVLCWVNFLHF